MADSHSHEQYFIGIFWVKIVMFILTVLFIVSIFLLYHRIDPYVRPFEFYVIVSVILTSLCVLFVVFFCKMRGGVKLITILFLIGVILAFVLSQYYMFPLVTGVDPWFHMEFNNAIVQTGRVPYSQPQYFGMYASSKVQYSRMPVFHLLVAIMRQIGGMDYKSATIFSVSLSQLLIVLIVLFLLSRDIFGSASLAIITATVAISSEHFIFMMRNVVPNSLGGVYLTLTILSLFLFLDTISIKKYSLVVFFSFILIITHSISTIAMFIGLITTFIFLVTYGTITGRPRSINKLVLMLIALLTVTVYFWWTYISGHTPKILDILKTGLLATRLIRGYSVMRARISLYSLIIGILPVIIYHIFALIGVSILLFEHGLKRTIANRYLIIILVVGGIYAMIGSIPRLLGLALLVQRWWYFSEIFLAIPVAITISSMLKHKVKFMRIVGVIVILTYFTLTLMEAQYVSIDGMSYYEKNNFRYALTESELQYRNFAEAHGVTCIATDEYYAYVLGTLGMKTESISNEILIKNFNTIKCPILGIRSYMLVHPIKVNQFVYHVPYNPLELLSPTEKWNIIYSSESLDVFRKVYPQTPTDHIV